jgi:hypothetical protein
MVPPLVLSGTLLPDKSLFVFDFRQKLCRIRTNTELTVVKQ